MGLMNWFMRGLGVETEEKGEDKKKSKASSQQETKYANFNLHEKDDGLSKAEQPASMSFGGFGVNTESNIILVKPKNKKDIQEIVDYLKQGQTVTMDLGEIADDDRGRILDFLSGAIYGLSGSIHQLQGDLFLLTSEGHKILQQKGEK